MTKEQLVTVREGVGQDEAKRLLHQHRIEKLLVVDDEYRCVGLITVKDIEKAVANPNACKDEQGRLRVAAATTVGDKGFERTERLIEAGVDLVVVDTAHGHSQARARRRRPHQAPVERGAGGRRQRRDRRRREGADRCRRRRDQGRHRPGLDLHHARSSPASACRSSPRSWTRSRSRDKTDTPVIADGGIKYSGDLAKALARRRRLRDDRLAARRHRRDARARCFSIRAAPTRPIAAWARSAPWRAARPTAISSRTSRTRSSSCRRASRARCPTRAPAATVLHQLAGGLRAAMGYVGAKTIAGTAREGRVRAHLRRRPAREPRARRDDHAREPELSVAGLRRVDIDSSGRCSRRSAGRLRSMSGYG